MFLEDTSNGSEKAGWIEVICGSMFSGKTEELIRRLKRVKFANQKFQIFKPHVDMRYDKEKVISHDKNESQSIPVKSPFEIISLSKDFDVVGIDEAQFFDEEIIEVCNILANSGIRVIVAGLDMDFQGKPFAPMPQIMAIAEYVTKVHAICVKCGNLAQNSHRFSGGKDLVELGELGSYEPLCRKCFDSIKSK